MDEELARIASGRGAFQLEDVKMTSGFRQFASVRNVFEKRSLT